MSNMLNRCVFYDSMLCMPCVRLTVAVIALIIGTFIAWQPKKSIDKQIAFYRLINWKIEPISMEREIKNTRIMGVIVLAAGILGIVCLYFF